MGVDPIEVATTVAAEAADLKDREASRLSSWVAITLVPTVLGALMGCAGLFGWRLHSDLLAQLLS